MAFLEAIIQDNKLDMKNDGDRQKLEDAFRARRCPNDDQVAFREFVELKVTVMDTQAQGWPPSPATVDRTSSKTGPSFDIRASSKSLKTPS